MLTLTPYIIGVLAAIAVVILPREKDLYVAIFFIPWVAIVIDFGVSVRVSEFLAAILLLKYFVTGRLQPTYFKGGVLLLLFLGLSIFSAYHTMEYGPAVPDFAGGSTLRNGYGRVFTSLLALSLKFSLLLLLFSLRDTLNVTNVLKVYVYSCLVLAVLGFIQLLVFMGSGIDIFPIGMLVTEDVRSGAVNIQGESFLRISSFGGEPKGLGQSLVVAFALIVLFGRQFNWSRQFLIIALASLVAAIIATVSTSAFIMMTVIFIFIVVMSRKRDPFSGAAIVKILLAISFGLFSVFYGIVYYQDVLQPITYQAADSFLDALKGRTIDRIQFDDTDAVIWESFVGDYFGLMIGRGMGLVHHYAHFFIPPHMLYYLGGSIVGAKSGLSFYIGNAGILGFIIITMFAAAMTPNIKDNRILLHLGKVKMIKQFQALCLGLWSAHLLRLYTFDITWLLFAVAAIAGFQLHNEYRQQKFDL